jgi:H+/gluconate symporter-like permease
MARLSSPRYPVAPLPVPGNIGRLHALLAPRLGGEPPSARGPEGEAMLLVLLLLLSIAFIVFATAYLKLHPFLALLLTAFAFGIASGMPLAQVVTSVNEGFGGTIGSIGIVILAGTIIGVFLEKSGGAFRLAESILRVTGQRNAPMAMSIMGYVVSIPVFCDSGFVILSALNKAVASRAGISLAATSVALALGLYAAHTMVPPTPGPVAAAGILGADLGLVILWGMIIGALAAASGWLFAILVAAASRCRPTGRARRPPRRRRRPRRTRPRRRSRSFRSPCRSCSSCCAPSRSCRRGPSAPAASCRCCPSSASPWSRC